MGQLEELKGFNTSRVFELLSTNGSMTRPELAKKTGLSRATIGIIVDLLLKRNLVYESGTGSSSGGRPPMLIKFNPEAAYAVGAGMYEQKWTVLFINLHGHIRDSESIEMRGLRPEDGVEAISEGLRKLQERNKAIDFLPRIGIGSPGLVDWHTGVVKSAVDVGWFEVPFGEMIEKAVGLPSLIINRGKLGALAEYWSRGKTPQELLYISVGTGIAAGIIHKGELYIGPTSSAGELGHTTILPEGPLCACGNRGCLQQLISEDAIASKGREKLRSLKNGPLHQIAGPHPEKLTALHVLQAAQEGDPSSIEILSDAARYLGIAVANLINMINPERVVLGGPIACSSILFCDLVREEVEKRAMTYPLSIVSVEQSRIGLDAAAIGAAVLVLQQAGNLLFDTDQSQQLFM
ncbi:MAG: ROK family transcriptional regulator [Spirochaetaceae bacterium]